MRAVIWGLLLEMLLKTGGNCETNTYKTLDLLQHNNITQEYTTHHLFKAILALTLLIYHTLGWMACQRERGSIYRARENHEVVTSVTHSRNFLDITTLFHLFYYQI